MAGNRLLRLAPVFGAAVVAIYLIGYAQTRFVTVPTTFLPGEDDTAFLDIVTEIVAGPIAFACVFFTLAGVAFWRLAAARPTARVLLVAGLLTPPYLLGLFIVGYVSPANTLIYLEPDAYTGRQVDREAFNLGWSPPALTAVLVAAAIAQVWGVLRLARGLKVTPSPRVARLLFLQPVWYAVYLAVCSFDIWFTSVTARPATPDEVAWGGMPEGLVRDAWSMLAAVAIAMAVVSTAMAAMGVAARRGSVRVRVLAGMVTPCNMLGLTVLATAGPLGPIGPYPGVAAEIRPVWHVPLLATLAGGAMISYLYAVRRSVTSTQSLSAPVG
ncbi:hypothetical protein AB0L53_20125 [Nonomuraea sp. NPDC052129]|uniref:hypothetical protein n=1 Tax=unclassified Nonomuraea TaxID=2593643 RepID=UPI0033D58800